VFVAVDCPWQPLIPEATADTSVMRLHGRNIKGWQAQMRGNQPSVAEKYDYLSAPIGAARARTGTSGRIAVWPPVRRLG